MTGLHHVGYWVPDLGVAVEHARRTLGIGPFLVARHVRFDTFRLADGTAIMDPGYLDHSAAFAAWGPIVLELAEVHSIDDALAAAYRIGPDRIGPDRIGPDRIGPDRIGPDRIGSARTGSARVGSDRTGHVAWVVDDLAAEIDRLDAAGCRLIHTAASGAVEVAWFDGGPLFPHPIEVHRAGPPILGMHERLATLARDWDGADPLRPI
jgi:catechol 2,3-dioxygenase-like lactoylglutathione lyase family enzyme